MCIRDRIGWVWWPVEWQGGTLDAVGRTTQVEYVSAVADGYAAYSTQEAVSYTHLRAHETVLDLVCRLLLEKKKTTNTNKPQNKNTITEIPPHNTYALTTSTTRTTDRT